MKDVELKSGPYECGGVLITKVKVQAPTGTKYLDLGEPWSVQLMPDGTRMTFWLNETIRQYVEHCLVLPSGVDPIVLMAQLSTNDARTVRESVLSFFGEAAHERRQIGS